MQNIAFDRLNAAQNPLEEVLIGYALLLEQGKINSLAPLMSLLTYEGKPMDLKTHFQLEPLYRFRVPRRTVCKTARQVGKSMAVVTNLILSSSLIPNFHNLLVEPQYTQMKHISTVMFKTLVGASLLLPLIKNGECPDSERLRAFINGSRVHFGYCGTNSGRLRGLNSISRLVSDETQDMDPDEMNIVAETMAAAPPEYGIYQYTGTPKTTDNFLSVLFNRSSGGEIMIPCSSCGKENVASLDHDLQAMIGKTTCICAKCGRPLDPREGRFVFARPERRNVFDGFHISQITHPLHCCNPSKWQELLVKVDTYPTYQVKNEIFGEACDEALKLVTRADLEKASHGHSNNLKEALVRAREYSTVVLGVDWGGGGREMQSYTCIAALGHRSRENVLDVLYMERLPIGKLAAEEANRVLFLATSFQAGIIAHDATGAGRIREELLTQAGADARTMVIPFSYVWAPRQDMIAFHKAVPGFKAYYSLDKTRSLALTCAALQARQIRVPIYNTCPELLDDFISLGEDIRDDRIGNKIRVIVRTGENPDDTAHAVNLAAQGLWYINRCTPSLGELTRRFAAPMNDLEAPGEKEKRLTKG